MQNTMPHKRDRKDSHHLSDGLSTGMLLGTIAGGTLGIMLMSHHGQAEYLVLTVAGTVVGLLLSLVVRKL
jgi:uncharacterized protein YcfJ